MPDISSLQQKLGITFAKPALLEQALVHSSYINEIPELGLASNERMEFLGDAVLGVIIAEKLYRDYPQFNEGAMTRLRAAVVRQESLARIALELNIGEFLFLGKGENSSGGRHKPANLASTLESVIAAIYLDQGLDCARKFILGLFNDEILEAIASGVAVDYKSRLQEIVQARQQVTPVYNLISETGPPHDKTFVVEVAVSGRTLGTGSGKSKKMAETEAARLALIELDNSFTE